MHFEQKWIYLRRQFRSTNGTPMKWAKANIRYINDLLEPTLSRESSIVMDRKRRIRQIYGRSNKSRNAPKLAIPTFPLGYARSHWENSTTAGNTVCRSLRYAASNPHYFQRKCKVLNLKSRLCAEFHRSNERLLNKQGLTNWRPATPVAALKY